MIVPLLANIFGAFNYAYNTQILTKHWYSLWTQVYLFYGMIFSPAMVGIICAYMWHMEHRCHLKHLLVMPYENSRYILAKNFVAWIYYLVAQLYFVILYFLIGTFYFQFETPKPTGLFTAVLLISILNYQMIAVQNFLSTKIKSFAVPVGLGIVLSLVGIFVATQNIIRPLQYLNANVVMTMTMNRAMENIWQELEIGKLVIGSLFVSVLFIFWNIETLYRYRQ